MYQALYRKWRPQTFDDVIGQKHITDSLKNQVSSGRLSHAYIFIGTRGTGKTTCARILAKAVNCEHPQNGNPCGVCPSCLGIANGTVMDIVELDAASNNGVDNVRALRDEATFTPADVRKRVYIIDEVHMLSTSAFNALLKIIEEPPEHLMFILATTELQKVPATILSRCQRHSFRRIERAELSAYLMQIAQKENISLAAEAADLIAGLAEGGVRDALSMLDQCSAYGTIGTEQVYTAVGLAGNMRLLELFGHICAHDTSAAVQLFDSLWKDGKDPVTLLRELSSLMRDILIVKVAPESATALIYGGYNENTLKQYAETMTVEELTAALDTLQTAIGAVAQRVNSKMTAELTVISLCQNLSGDSVSSLRGRIAALERAVARGIPSAPASSAAASFPQAGAAPVSRTISPPEPVAPEEKPAARSSVPAAGAQERRTVSAGIGEYSLQNAAAAERRPGQSREAAVSEPVAEQSGRGAEQEVKTAGTSLVERWQDICTYVRDLLPVGIRTWLSEPGRITPWTEGGVLYLETEPGFFLMQLNRPEITAKFESAVSAVTGAGITVRVRERKEKRDTAPKGDINDLRIFPEVRFVE